MNQRGFLHLLPLLLIVAIIVAVVLVVTGKLKLPFSVPFLQQGPKVDLKTEYKNPFNKETQYVNPFDTYKNPFVTNR
ncbi:MAG: Uncharacterized protein CEO21_137 [Microgenomates group bacterium Gr01-1014_80]|nr:MAG: Uncharacterized protein CEO21_137 [Microgenomates group bacterium Gr01-1014_80]